MPKFFPGKKRQPHPTSQWAAFERLKSRPILFNTVFDVGASNGRWSVEFMEHFPQARYHCIEAQLGHASALKKFAASHKNVSYVIAAAGSSEGTVHFEVENIFGGRASLEKDRPVQVPVRMTTLDAQVREFSLPRPFLIKLDTHGFEWPILEGAQQTLADSAALIIEMYNFSHGPPMLRFYEICQKLDDLGFRPWDLFDPVNRPSDGMLWQFDLILLRKDRPEFADLAFP